MHLILSITKVKYCYKSFYSYNIWKILQIHFLKVLIRGKTRAP